jgi:GPH family glycoside/pentoside/hexuronide:cation symporter
MKKDTTRPKRLPISEKIAWGTGGFSEQLAVNGLNNLFIPIFNIGLGMNSILIGWAIAIPRLFDMITDPFVGNLSDNSRNRFGRRKPFIFIGGILMALSFGISYMASPYWGNAALFTYAVCACMLFYLMYTLYTVPYYALGLELVEDYDERADLQKYRLIFASVATFTLPWLYKICISSGEFIREFVQGGHTAWYGFIFNPLVNMATNDDVAVEVLGVRYVAWGVAIAIAVSALPSSLFTRENTQAENPEKINLFRSAKLVLKNKSFRVLCLMIFFVIPGMFFMSVLVTYANIFYISDGNKSDGATWNGYYGTMTGIASLIATFFIPILVRRFDKKIVLIGGLLLSSLTIMASWFLLNPSLPTLQLLLAGSVGAGISTCWLLSGAFIADICDEDEYLYGYRREGIFSAFYGFVVKMAFSGIAFTLGYALELIGYSAGSDQMTAETLQRLRLFIAFFPSTCLIAAIIIFSRYQLSRKRLEIIQDALRQRNHN